MAEEDGTQLKRLEAENAELRDALEEIVGGVEAWNAAVYTITNRTHRWPGLERAHALLDKEGDR